MSGRISGFLLRQDIGGDIGQVDAGRLQHGQLLRLRAGLQHEQATTGAGLLRLVS